MEESNDYPRCYLPFMHLPAATDSWRYATWGSRKSEAWSLEAFVWRRVSATVIPRYHLWQTSVTVTQFRHIQTLVLWLIARDLHTSRCPASLCFAFRLRRR